MKKGTIVLIVVLAVIAIFAISIFGSYNSLVSLDEDVKIGRASCRERV